MKKSKLLGSGLTLLALGGALFGLSTLENARPEWVATLPSWTFGAILLLAVVFTVMGLLMISSTVIHIPYFSRFYHMDCRPVGRKEIKILFDFSEEYFSDGISLNETKRLQRLNEDMFIAVWREKEKTLSHGVHLRMVGFFSILPVSEAAKSLLDSNSFKAEHFTEEYILKSRKGAAAIYLGGVAARRSDMGQVLAYLIIAMTKVVASGHRELYTRPTTKRGLKLAQQYGFVPVSQEGLDQIYRLEFDLVDERMADPERVETFIKKVKKRHHA